MLTMILYALLWATPKVEAMRGPYCDDCGKPMVAPERREPREPREGRRPR